MKVTRLGRTRPVVGIGSLTGGVTGNPGQVVAVGSNGYVARDAVLLVSADGNPVSGPFVNLAAGSNITLTRDSGPGGSMPSNTIRIHSTGGGGSSLTVADEGVDLSTAATKLDFVGAGVTASGTGATKTITIPGGGSGGDLTLISETVLGSAAADITITGIPNTYRDLLLIVSARSAQTGQEWSALHLRVGDGSIDTGSNYKHFRYLVGTGTVSAGNATGDSSGMLLGIIPSADTSQANEFGVTRIDLFDYHRTDRNKAAHSQSGFFGDEFYNMYAIGEWNNNASAEIDQVRVYVPSYNLITGSRLAVYGRT
jgi:hypothetical protein